MDAVIHNPYPLISIVIPIYKVERYLRFCLDSVQKQTYTNLQILLINDGSPDQCEKICLEYCKKDSRFEYHYKENGGVGEARNYALKYFIKGKYISFLDSDDAIHPQQIEILYHLLQRHPECSFSLAKFERFNSEKYINNKGINIYSEKVYSNKEAIKRLFGTGSTTTLGMMATWNKLYKTCDITGCKFHKQSPAEDIYFNCQYFPKISNFVETEEVLLYYRYNPNSITSKPTINYWLINAERMGDVYENLDNLYPDLKDKALQCIIRKYLSTKYEIKKETPIDLKQRCQNIGKIYFSKYLHSNDSLKMKFILGTFYYLPFTYRWFRAFMEWKAK